MKIPKGWRKMRKGELITVGCKFYCDGFEFSNAIGGSVGQYGDGKGVARATYIKRKVKK